MDTINKLLVKLLPQITNAANRKDIYNPVVVDGAGSSPVGTYFFFMKGGTTTVTDVKDLNGVSYSSDVIAFLNTEVPELVKFTLPFSQITLSAGSVLIGESYLKIK